MLAPRSPTLPTDIFEEILSHSLPRPTLLSCSLTNHLLRDLSLKRLFYYINISTSLPDWARTRKLLPLLQKNPALYRYVKELYLNLQGFQEPSGHTDVSGVNWDENASKTFIEVLQHLEEVHILSVGSGTIARVVWMTLPVEVRGVIEKLIGSHSLTKLSMSFITGIPGMVLRRARNLRALELDGWTISDPIETHLHCGESGLLGPIALISLSVRYTWVRWEGNQDYRTLFQWMNTTCHTTSPDSFPLSFRNLSRFEAEVPSRLSQPIQGVLNSCAETLTSLRLQLIGGKWNFLSIPGGWNVD